jgi:hypothetical protein
MGSRLLEIQKVDHVIVGTPVAGRSGYFSFKEAGLISQKGKSAIWEKLGRRQQPEPKWVKTSLHSSETLFHRRYKLLVLASQLLSVVNRLPAPIYKINGRLQNGRANESSWPSGSGI